jgi:hypothetical protein
MLFAKETKNFVQARQACFTASAELASVHDKGEAEELANALQPVVAAAHPEYSAYQKSLAWLGLARKDYPSTLVRTTDKSQWTWMSTGVYPEWDNWQSGQPDANQNGVYKEGVCATFRMTAGAVGLWYVLSVPA